MRKRASKGLQEAMSRWECSWRRFPVGEKRLPPGKGKAVDRQRGQTYYGYSDHTGHTVGSYILGSKSVEVDGSAVRPELFIHIPETSGESKCLNLLRAIEPKQGEAG